MNTLCQNMSIASSPDMAWQSPFFDLHSSFLSPSSPCFMRLPSSISSFNKTQASWVKGSPLCPGKNCVIIQCSRIVLWRQSGPQLLSHSVLLNLVKRQLHGKLAILQPNAFKCCSRKLSTLSSPFNLQPDTLSNRNLHAVRPFSSFFSFFLISPCLTFFFFL